MTPDLATASAILPAVFKSAAGGFSQKNGMFFRQHNLIGSSRASGGVQMNATSIGSAFSISAASS